MTDELKNINLPLEPNVTAGPGVAARPEYLRIRKTIRLAVTGDVQLTRTELCIIDEPDFQRLKGIRQLGMTCTVYPSALHTRFEHSLGTLAMVARMILAIRENTHNRQPDEFVISPEQEAIARLYALLHDICHVPFGHTIEDELGIFQRHDKNVARLNRFLGPDSSIGTLIRQQLGENLYSRLMNVYRWDEETLLTDGDEFIYDLVSNTLCADLLDYLARDNAHCNLDHIDTEYRFLSFLYLGRDAQDRRRPFIRLWKSDNTPREDTLLDLFRLMEARYRLAERAYFHHAKIVASSMLGRALQEAILAGEINEDALYWHSDDSLLRALALSQATVASRLATALQRRSLHKLIREYRHDEFASVQAQNHSVDAKRLALGKVATPDARREFEDQLSAELGAEPGDVVIYALPEDGTNFKHAAVNVFWDGKASILRHIDHKVTDMLNLVIDGHKRLWGIRVLVSPELAKDPGRVELVIEACDIAFVTLPDQVERRQRNYLAKLVRKRLQQSAVGQPLLPNEMETRVDRVVEHLRRSAREHLPWAERLDSSIRREFGIDPQ